MKGATCGIVDQASLEKESSLMSLELNVNSVHHDLQSSMVSSRGNVSEVLDAAVAPVLTF